MVGATRPMFLIIVLYNLYGNYVDFPDPTNAVINGIRF